jgi:UDP-N-acetylglucosamine 4,6-dehydratase
MNLKINKEEEDMNLNLNNKVIFVTGGTGSFGRAFVKTVLAKAKPKKIIVFSRDEWKQSEMAKELSHPCLRWFIGDVRDRNRLFRGMEGADIVIHAAALKQIPVCEYNPFEAIKTNVIGAENVIDAAIDLGVKQVVALSTDKAVNPINLYGATKLCAEKMFVQGNTYAASRKTRFACVRYGNVVGSRGSVVPLFLAQKETGTLTVTDRRMTRFWITLEQSVELVLNALKNMAGGEIFIPKIPSMKIVDLAAAIAPECQLQETGIRPGEKLHEVLITEDESLYTWEFPDYFVIHPLYMWWGGKKIKRGKKVPENFIYRSNTNHHWLKKEEILKCLPK